MAKKKKTKKKTDKPTGISITRKKYKFIVSWHRGEKYESQEFHYRVNDGKWHEKNISKTASKEDFELTPSKWFPNESKKVSKITVKIEGKAKKEKAVEVSKSIRIKKPKKPAIAITSLGDNWVTFNIIRPDVQERKPVKKVEYDYVIVSDYKGNDSAKSYWKTGKHSSSFEDESQNQRVSFDGNIDGKKSKTVIIRARCLGMGGDSGYVYKHHVFSNPYEPKDIVVTSYLADRKSNITKIGLKWTAPSSKSHPIDSTTVQYVMGTPTIERRYVEQDNVRGCEETILDEGEYVYSFTQLLSSDVFVSKIVLIDENGEEIDKNDIKYDISQYTSELIAVNIRAPYGKLISEAEVYWILNDVKFGTDEDLIYVKDSRDRFIVATYEQLCDFDTDYDFYRQKLVFRPPEGASPTDGVVQRDTKAVDKAVLTIDTILGYDQCIWVRIKTIHDERPNYSDWVLAHKGVLSPPTITSISPADPTTYKMTVGATNNSTVPYSFLAIVYQDSDSTDYAGKVLGIIPSGESSAEFQCPVWDGHEPFSFGVYAVCGRVNYKNCKEITDAGTPDPVIIYSLYQDMKSEVIYNAGTIPVAPKKVTVDKVEGKKGTVQVTWESTWKEATGAEVSWADHDDAWYSTNGPSSYTVESIKQPRLNISGLATGMKWYVCVRLYRNMADGSTVYGPPSDVMMIDLSEAPSIPVLTLTPSNVASYTSEIKASWTYVVEDNSEQASATLAEVIEGEDEPVVLRQFTTETLWRFKPEDINNDDSINLDWSTGTNHSLVVMVSSTGGQSSAWSEAVNLTVEEPIVCTIGSTNLQRGTIGEPLDYPVLGSLPLTVTVGGGDDNDIEAVMIKRFSDFPITRPDNSEYVGYEGETICYKEADEEIKILSQDTSVNTDKKYFTYDSLTEIYTQVEPEGSENPSSLGWYENEPNNTITIGLEDLEDYGTQFDDGALYQIVASVQAIDSEGRYGQLAVIPNEDNTNIIPDPLGISEQNFEFFGVRWDTQAIIPDEDDEAQWIDAEILYDETVIDRRWKPGVGVIHIGDSPVKILSQDTSVQPGKKYYVYDSVTETYEQVDPVGNEDPSYLGWYEQDTAHLDIYRLSAGKPQLIYQGATFETDYVDPYPTIGERGGYRVVYITENGDYITDDGPAWVDLDGGLDTKFQLIDFSNKEIEFKFNVSFDNSWNKQFTLTHYLGGKVEGDWIEGVEHTHNVRGVTIDDLDIETGTLDNIRELAEYAGICHVRTIEGFNYTANINVSDSSEYNHPYHDHNITFDITEVANPELDGMTWEDWNKEEEEED